jgi:hypothetical protein
MLRDEPKGWKRLQGEAQRERDPQKLALIIDQLNRLLDQHERLAAKRDARESGNAAGGSSKEFFA